MNNKSSLRIATRLSGVLWMLSWIGMYLEIFYWHHMTPSLRLNLPPPVPGKPPPRPGGFLITIIVSSVLAPLVFLTLILVPGARRKAFRS